MFAKNIIESDAFYDLSAEEQVLYLHLGMNADDDGIVDNARTVARSCGYKPDVINSLIKKRFLIQLENGLVLIKHWKINNYVQKDRYKPTAYTEEFSKVVLKDNGSYTEAEKLMDTQEPETLDTQYVDTQVRLGKDRLGKDRVNSVGRFTPPTLEEIKAYCIERSNNVDPVRFFNYYESNGWKVGRNRMKDWKAAVRTWERSETKKQSQSFEEMLSTL